MCLNTIGTISNDQLIQDAAEQSITSCSCGTTMCTDSAVRFATDRNTGDFRGFGHVEFEEEDAAEKAVAVAGTNVAGRPIRVDYSVPRAPKAKTW